MATHDDKPSKYKHALKEATRCYKANKKERAYVIEKPDEHAQHPVALFFALAGTGLNYALFGMTGLIVMIALIFSYCWYYKYKTGTDL